MTLIKQTSWILTHCLFLFALVCRAQEAQQKWPCKDDPDLLRDPNGRPVLLKQDELKSRLVWVTRPQYPRGCRCEGPVQFLVHINTWGRVECFQFLSGHPLLKASIAAALGKWQFDPFIKDSKAVSVTGILTYTFKLDDEWNISQFSVSPCSPRQKILRNESGNPVWLEPDEMNSRATEKVQPLRDTHFKGQGYVLVNVLVDAEGKVICAMAVNGHPLLREAALSAAIKWKFNPMSTDSKPVSFYGHLLFFFSSPPGR